MKKTNKKIPIPLPPPGLKKGDIIGLAPLAGPWQEEKFAAGIRILAELGFQTRIPPKKNRQDYLACSDQERLDFFHDLWQDQKVAAIMAVRGGYGCLRLIDDIDFELIRERNKILIGFSDVTVLLNVLHCQTGLITFHGPMLTTMAATDKKSIQELFKRLTSRDPASLTANQVEILKPGSARGRLLGGNLTTLTHLLSTPYEPSFTDAILFLEDIGEHPYRIDRMLTQLKLAGKIDKISGLILGGFDNCGDIQLIWKRILELFEADIPIWANFPAGHGKQNITLPIGVEVKMDGSKGLLKICSPCIR